MVLSLNDLGESPDLLTGEINIRRERIPKDSINFMVEKVGGFIGGFFIKKNRQALIKFRLQHIKNYYHYALFYRNEKVLKILYP